MLFLLGSMTAAPEITSALELTKHIHSCYLIWPHPRFTDEKTGSER